MKVFCKRRLLNVVYQRKHWKSVENDPRNVYFSKIGCPKKGLAQNSKPAGAATEGKQKNPRNEGGNEAKLKKLRKEKIPKQLSSFCASVPLVVLRAFGRFCFFFYGSSFAEASLQKNAKNANFAKNSENHQRQGGTKFNTLGSPKIQAAASLDAKSVAKSVATKNPKNK